MKRIFLLGLVSLVAIAGLTACEPQPTQDHMIIQANDHYRSHVWQVSYPVRSNVTTNCKRVEENDTIASGQIHYDKANDRWSQTMKCAYAREAYQGRSTFGYEYIEVHRDKYGFSITGSKL